MADNEVVRPHDLGSAEQLEEIVTAALWLRSYMDRIEDFWERGDGSRTPPGGPPFHNMGVYGWDLLDPQLLTSTLVASRLARPTTDDRPTSPRRRWRGPR